MTTPAAAALLNEDSEVVVKLANGWTLRSGVYDKDDPEARLSGEYVRLVSPDGAEDAYWDQAEWAADPALVMGAIINSAAGLTLEPRDITDDMDDDEIAAHNEAMANDPQYRDAVHQERN